MHNHQLLPKFFITYLATKNFDIDINNTCGPQNNFRKNPTWWLF
jgi:hypothetical protein